MTHNADYVACGRVNNWMNVRCIRPVHHDGKHSGTLMVPQRVWWSDARVFDNSAWGRTNG